MNIQLLRHATLLIHSGNNRILVDPMLSPARTADPIPQTPNPLRNPLVDLPMDDAALKELIESLDAVIVTHTHSDHWDDRARELLPNTLPVFCQPEDQERIREAGFTTVRPVETSMDWEGLQILRTGGQHGRGKIGKLMAPVSGFVLKSEGGPVVYIAGDTIWCAEVEQVIQLYQPDKIIVNAGAAQFNTGGAITMTTEDVISASKAAPQAEVFAVHMEAINHCLLSRNELRHVLLKAGLVSRVRVPEDGEWFVLE